MSLVSIASGSPQQTPGNPSKRGGGGVRTRGKAVETVGENSSAVKRTDSRSTSHRRRDFTRRDRGGNSGPEVCVFETTYKKGPLRQ